MTTRFIAAAMVVFAVASPPLAHAVEFPPEAAPPPMVQTPSGFIGVPGPHAWSPEHFQAFPPPPTQHNQVQACGSCPVPAQPPVQAAPTSATR
jgi:hypothetical protein